jgi:hypothetical protein
MRTRTRNVTVAIPEHLYREARLWAARYDYSLSGAVGFILEHLSDLTRAVRYLDKENPHWGKDGIH